MIKTIKDSCRIACCTFFAYAGAADALNVDMNFSGFAHFEYAKAMDNDGFGPLNLEGDEDNLRDANALGMRLEVDTKHNISFATQMIARGVDDYEPEFEWIYVNFHLTPELDILVGRTRMPLFMYSDYFDVGYAYPWVSPPSSVYGDAPFRTMEGVTLKYVTDFWVLTSELMVWGGETEEAVGTADIELDNIRGVSWTVGYEWLSIRGVYSETNTKADTSRISGVPELLGLIQSLEAGTGRSGVFEKFAWEDDDFDFTGIGVSMDFGSYFFIAEASRVRPESTIAIGERTSYYLTGGIRLDDWTITLTYADDESEVNDGILDSYVTNFIEGAAPNSAAGQLALNSLDLIEGAILSQQNSAAETLILSTRWDFHPKAAATIEFLDSREGSSLIDKSWEKTSPRALRLALDLVF